MRLNAIATPFTSMRSGAHHGLLCAASLQGDGVSQHAARPHLNEAPPPWPARGLSSFALYSGSDSAPPLGMAAGVSPAGSKCVQLLAGCRC